MPKIKFPIFSLIPDDLFLVHLDGEDCYVCGFFYVEKDGTSYIIIATQHPFFKIYTIFIHELLHWFTYALFSNDDVREKIDDIINKFCRYPFE